MLTIVKFGDNIEEDAESNAATDQSGNRSETEESYRETAGEIGHSISVVTKKVI